MEHFESAVGRGLVFEFDVAESVCVFVSLGDQNKIKERKRKEKKKMRSGKSPFAQASAVFDDSNRCHLASFFKLSLHIALCNIEEEIPNIESSTWR